MNHSRLIQNIPAKVVPERPPTLTESSFTDWAFDVTLSDINRHGAIVQPKPDGSLRVVIQGSMKARFVPGKHVALDGFYKHPDGTVSTMPDEEFYEFD